MKKAFTAFSSHLTSVVVLIGAMVLAFADLSWGKSQASYSPYPIQVNRNQSPLPGIDVSRRQQGSPQMDADAQRNWKRYQGLTPDDKAGLREKSQRWQSLPPEDRNQIRDRLRNWDSLSPQEQQEIRQRFQKR